jgi:hypothetical protein
VLELHQRADISEAVLSGQMRFMNVAADLVAVYHRNQRFSKLAAREDQWRQVDQFAQAVYRPLELQETAYEIANEGRRIIGCDRLTVIVQQHRRWQVLAVSGADRVNRRSSLLAGLERLAGPVAAQRRTLWSGQDAQELPPELGGPLDDYHDGSSARLAAFLPLPPASANLEDDKDGGEDEPFAVLVVEHFDKDVPKGLRERCEAVCRHSTAALRRAVISDQMPLHSLSRQLGKLRWVSLVRRQPKSLLLAAALAILLIAMAIIPTSLRVEATGTLGPQAQRHLFAPTDGVIERLLVRETGQHVGADEELILLRDPDLRFETERIFGELETARKQLAAIEAERLHADRTSRIDLRDAALRSAEEETLKKQIQGLERQQAILNRRRDELTVRSPMKGQLLTWDVEQLLQSRPVARGQILLTVANLQGLWELELEIPDDRVSDVSEAIGRQEGPLTVRFILATAPETRYIATLEKIAPATDVRGDRGPSVSAVAYPEDQQAMRTLRPGATVVAKIDCGRRSLLYVLFHGLVRTIRSRLLF